MSLIKALRIILSFTLVLLVSASAFYYPMFKEAVGVMPQMSRSKKIVGCKDQVACWKKVINDNMEKDFFFPTKQSLVMNYFLYLQYEISNIKDAEKKKEFSKEALHFMNGALDGLEVQLKKEVEKPFTYRDLFFPFSQFYRYAQLTLAKDTIELTREKVVSYYKNYKILED